ncbi:MAG: DUF4936 family protein [Glaciimonas sp.]|nr:DUF4936 family protein [Glaciimonas sp.]
MDYYIYYQVGDAQAQPLRDKVLPLQAALQQQYQIGTALKRHPDRQDGRQTWMEIYLAVPDGFDAALAAALAAAEIAPLIDGERHIERFIPVL